MFSHALLAHTHSEVSLHWINMLKVSTVKDGPHLVGSKLIGHKKLAPTSAHAKIALA